MLTHFTFLNDLSFMLQRRKILEREARMRGLRANYNMVLEQSAQSMVSTSRRGILTNLACLEQLEIADRAQRLRQRVEFLSCARNEFALDVEINDGSERFVGIFMNWSIADINDIEPGFLRCKKECIYRGLSSCQRSQQSFLLSYTLRPTYFSPY
jgi:hypothetical protein